MAQTRVQNHSLLSFLLLLPLIQICSCRNGIISENNGNTNKYIVVFDTGKYSTSAHVFRFNENSNILKIDGKFDTQFSADAIMTYANDIDKIKNVLAPILQNAVDVVPTNRRSETPLIFGASDEMWFLGEEKCENILQAVRDVFSGSPLLYDSNWIKILPGTKQGVYLWATINYLLGNMGGDYSKTVSVLNQEFASIETVYAVSKQVAKEDNEEVTKREYITPHYFNGTTYYLYSHSYWPYGAYAVRGEILKYTNNSYSYCVLSGYDGQLDYFGTIYNARSALSGSSYEKCRDNVLKVLNLNATCHVKKCTFNGVWNGGKPAGVQNLYIASGFRFTGVDIGLVNSSDPTTELRLMEYEKVAKQSCAAKSLEETQKLFPDVPSFDLPYLCMDLVYLYSVLVDGFGIGPTKMLTTIDSVIYEGDKVDTTWHLGAALESASSKKSSITNIPFYVSHPSVQII